MARNQPEKIREMGYIIADPCPVCGGDVRTWRVGTENKPERIVQCMTCWRFVGDRVNWEVPREDKRHEMAVT